MSPECPQGSRAGATGDRVQPNAAKVTRGPLTVLFDARRMGWEELSDCLDGLLAAAVDVGVQRMAEPETVGDALQNAAKTVVVGVVGNTAAGSVDSSAPCSTAQSPTLRLVNSLRQSQQKSTGPCTEGPRTGGNPAACSARSCAARVAGSPAASSPLPASSDPLRPWPGATGASTPPHSATGAGAEAAGRRARRRAGRGRAEEASSRRGAGVLFVRSPSPAPSVVWKGQAWQRGRERTAWRRSAEWGSTGG